MDLRAARRQSEMPRHLSHVFSGDIYGAADGSKPESRADIGSGRRWCLLPAHMGVSRCDAGGRADRRIALQFHAGAQGCFLTRPFCQVAP